MGEPYLGEIKVISWNFPPKGWAFCNGQLLPINQNQALFAILGTTYGGDGRQTFALPNLQGRVPLHVGDGISLGQTGGELAHTLTIQELPSHTHPASGDSNAPTLAAPANAFWASRTSNGYAAAGNAAMHPASLTVVGGSQPHNNLSPFLVLNFIIALQGIFPSQN